MNNNFGYPSLDKVEQSYIRIPVTIVFTIILLVIGIPFHVWDGWKETIQDFFIPCFIGPNKEN